MFVCALLSLSILTPQWCRYWAYKKPNLFYPCVMAAAMPVFLFAVTPLRQKYLFADVTEVPTEYPLPIRKRDATLTGYED